MITKCAYRLSLLLDKCQSSSISLRPVSLLLLARNNCIIQPCSISSNKYNGNSFLIVACFKLLCVLLTKRYYITTHSQTHIFCFVSRVDKRYIQRESKKGDTILLSISLLNIDRFSQFFHRRTQLEISNKIINKDPTSPQMCCYTTL